MVANKYLCRKIISMHRRLSITVISPYFYPEDTAIGLYTTQFCKYLQNAGHQVSVLTGFPNYPNWKIFDDYIEKPPYYTETFNGIKVFRYKQYIPDTISIARRVRMMLSLMWGTMFNIGKVDMANVVICIVPFTSNIFPAWVLAKKHRAKLWTHIQDFEFDLALESGIIKNGVLSGIAAKLILGFERILLNRADVISSISNGMLEKIRRKSKHAQPYYFPNWVSADNINPEKHTRHPLIKKGKFTVLYSGNIGEKQNWDTLIEICKKIPAEKDIEILIVGDGVYKNTLEKRVAQFDFVRMAAPVRYEELNDLLCSADCHILFQKSDIIDTLMPSKILGMMASAKPSLVTGNMKSEVAKIFDNSGGGVYLTGENTDELVATILSWKENASAGAHIGKKARDYILREFSERQILHNFEKHILNLCS